MPEIIVGKIKTFLFEDRHLLGLNVISKEPVEFQLKINEKNQLILEGPVVKSSKIDNSWIGADQSDN